MSSEPLILELRVHGVRNTPPDELLTVAAEDVVPAEANGIKLVDDLAGFYCVKSPPRYPPTRLEAYSWGKLDRFAPKGLKGKTSLALYNIGWFTIAPFGFANAAYWSRVLKADSRRQDGVDPGTGAALVRLFSLLLTLLLASSVAIIAMDLVAVQCFRVEGTTHQMCNNLPHWFDGLRNLTRGQRLGAVSPFPIAAVALLAVVSLSSDVRFRTRIQDLLRAPHRGVPGRLQRHRSANNLKDSFVLAAHRLWIRRTNSPSGIMHLAATTMLVAFLLSADLKSSGDTREWSTAVLVFSGIVLAAITVVVMEWGATSVRALPKDTLPGHRGWSRMAWALLFLLLSVLLYGGSVALACTAKDLSETAPFTAAQLVPTVLVALLAILAMSGCLMRLAPAAAYSWGLILGAIGGVGLSIVVATWNSTNIPVSAAFALCGLCVLAVSCALLRQGERTPVRPLGRKAEAWNGLGPAVMMSLSLLLAAFYSSAAVVGVGNFLQGGALVWKQDPDHPLFRDLQEDSFQIQVPFLYWAAGGVMVLLALAVVSALGALMLLSQRRTGWILDPQVNDAESDYEREILAVRRRSALLQRGEPVVGWAAASAVAGVLAVIALTLLHENGDGHHLLQNLPFWHAIAPAAKWITTSTLTAAGLLIVGVAIANAAKGGGRPLGLLWDLVAWLPRAGHPFGPACYSERAVPELADRMLQWLEEDGISARVLSKRRVLLATHSLGSILGIAALYHLVAIGKGELLTKIRLLTFGVQLRPYFGRSFPDLWGPGVLGTAGVRGPRLFKSDPWEDRDLPMTYQGGSTSPEAGNVNWGRRQLAELMKVNEGSEIETVWLNIWRRTDYLGFPVKSYGSVESDSTMDKVALEIEPDSYQAVVATHGNYLRTTKYTEARTRLLEYW